MTQPTRVARRGRRPPPLALIGVTAAWGSTFFMIKDVLEEMSVVDFLAVRFAIAAVFLFGDGSATSVG